MSLFSKRAPALVATIAAAALMAGGCGGDSDKSISVADAKAKLSKDCQEGKTSDKRLCDCIADELAKGGTSGKQIDAVRREINRGTENKLVNQAARACGLKLGQDAAG